MIRHSTDVFYGDKLSAAKFFTSPTNLSSIRLNP
ncbi:hypothetical protein CBM2615_B60107 [Cupriavidus taiwanensis]|uniref:Uncharacterized protein n=1 Tax=Cupriavidus taiwanensis TaxID=164546 RepID=A0A375EC71_9BURK|nr:hypothetical protein CBM2614_B50100 [Cupriavidus taiwanensis]SOZ69774.1 hypothetical protein CBM2615_B60107 [Cupriavidus taiwanensis]SOZ72956.1 hypothetical protein CBM2613_B50103 [Cupriavidus taiwanensis]SPA09863.1 hypothetical protein CBM2625_B60019 [Cupriavidus taiwanensis]